MLPRFLKPLFAPLRLWYVSTFARPVPELEEVEKTTKVLYPKYLRKDDVVIEVGARIGAATMLLSNLTNYVYSFEPNKDNFRMLRAYTRKLDNVSAFNIALGEYDGKAVLKISKNDSFSAVSSLKGLANHDYVDSQEVQISALDSLHFDFQPSSLVLDCEGAEAEVIRGGKKTIEGLRSVLVETHILHDGTSTRKDVIAALSPYQDRFIMTDEKVQGSKEAWLCFVRN